MKNAEMIKQIAQGSGFIAALDQSGGSTPKALRAYGVEDTEYSNETEMFDLIHQMRSRIIKSPCFTGEKILGAILFERTMDGEVDGVPTAEHLWTAFGVVPFLKVDKGLRAEERGVQLMKPMPQLDKLCEKAVQKGIFGTKMRSNVMGANKAGIAAIVNQQFEKGYQIFGHGLMPILEPEVNINIQDKAAAEDLLRQNIFDHLDEVPEGMQVMIKLTLPEQANHYKPLIDHPKVLRVVALSGGYSRDDACEKLSKNTGMIASFSRALSQGLSADQSEAEFDSTLASSVDKIYDASCAG